MGAGEEGTPIKSSNSKPTSSQQEAVTPAYPDWSTSMQAFYGTGAALPFFASTVAPPTHHPYMWGSQHPLMTSYGTPVPYPALYPPGGIYAHPNMATTPGGVRGAAEFDRKDTEVNNHASSKKACKASGNHGLIAGKSKDSGTAASGSGNDVGAQSGVSGSENSSDASADNNDQEFSAAKKGSFDQMLAEGANAQVNAIPANFHSSNPGNSLPCIPATNLNIGMDQWNASPARASTLKLRPNPPGVSPSMPQSGMMNEQWNQNERELKRQKRKQSNRESARRSRLRKQAECEELQQRVELLNNENSSLRDELQRLSEECEKLTSENNSIKEELTSLCGPDALSKLESSFSATRPLSREDEDNYNRSDQFRGSWISLQD